MTRRANPGGSDSSTCSPAPRQPSAALRLALLAIRCYQSYLSVFFAGTCRFEPTCSAYAYQAIERFGIATGIWLGIKRLSRCQPFSGKFGYDPVPENLAGASGHPETPTYAAAVGARNPIAAMKDGTSL